MSSRTSIGLVLLALAAWLAIEAWQHVQPALSEGWLAWGAAGRIFLPIILLAGIVIVIWRR